jgi:uncharacterized protein YcgL (UPF0745 family)
MTTEAPPHKLDCSIFKSRRKPDMYLYLTGRDDLSPVPEGLLKLLGALEHVMDLELTPDRRLAKEDPAQVMANLREHGYHIQFPDPAATAWD